MKPVAVLIKCGTEEKALKLSRVPIVDELIERAPGVIVVVRKVVHTPQARHLAQVHVSLV